MDSPTNLWMDEREYKTSLNYVNSLEREYHKLTVTNAR